MKIYSWKTLLAAFAGVAFIVYQIFHFNGFSSLIFIVSALVLSILFRRRKAHPEKWHDQSTPPQKEK